MNEIQIMMATNDPDNGNFTGRCDAIDIAAPGAEIVMELRSDRPLSVTRLGRRNLRLGHTSQRILGYSTWVGNWCWDMVTVDVRTAVKIINYLRQRGWQCEAGERELYDLYTDGYDLTPADLERVPKPDTAAEGQP
jgi:hypothetical protein